MGEGLIDVKVYVNRFMGRDVLVGELEKPIEIGALLGDDNSKSIVLRQRYRL
jgi:hypothetical protein